MKTRLERTGQQSGNAYFFKAVLRRTPTSLCVLSTCAAADCWPQRGWYRIYWGTLNCPVIWGQYDMVLKNRPFLVVLVVPCIMWLCLSFISVFVCLSPSLFSWRTKCKQMLLRRRSYAGTASLLCRARTRLNGLVFIAWTISPKYTCPMCPPYPACSCLRVQSCYKMRSVWKQTLSPGLIS